MARGRHSIVLLAALTSFLLGGVAWGEASTVVERHTNLSFQQQKDFNSIPHVLVGVGARRAAGMINVYGAGMYVGTQDGTRAWREYLSGRFAKAGLVPGGQPDFEKLQSSPEGRHYLVYGRMPRAIEMAFSRDVRADQITGAYEESWDRVRLNRAAAGPALTQFMEAVNHPMQKGQRMVIRTAGDTIEVVMPQGTTTIRGNEALIVGIWKIWFGDPALQRPLRDGMMSLLANVHRLGASQ